MAPRRHRSSGAGVLVNAIVASAAAVVSLVFLRLSPSQQDFTAISGVKPPLPALAFGSPATVAASAHLDAATSNSAPATRTRFSLTTATTLVVALAISVTGAAARRRCSLKSTGDVIPHAHTGQPVRRSSFVRTWGVFGVAFYLSYGVQKVIPIVREGVSAISSPCQWVMLVLTVIFFAYVEGYKGFTLGFAPRVVSRAWAVSKQTPGDCFLHKVFAPAFCIGYFHGTRARVITSWTVTSIVFALVVSVKRLGQPYRGIIDAGVMVGLAWGVASILIIFARSLRRGGPPDFDPALPKHSPY